MNKTVLSILATVLIGTKCHAFDLTGTYFYASGQKHDVDPTLLFAMALAESGKRDGGNVSPYPYALRTHEPFYPGSKIEAVKKLTEIFDSGTTKVDVGVMQVNVYWQRHLIDDPFRLLDPEYNIDTGAQVLAENIQLSNGDIALAVSRYNSWTDPRAYAYSQRVMSIYANLKQLER
ncbi:lytic transglycosylase domain-containing protein [Photobacterium ganghwense]|uniref:lytic transglycosylase domain-containing protein n=1 Tax=Photobacterium ganghwense TaxID=320778 RepID=UPI001A8F9E76|nr:lytic transglycosylase domain-containing protein [Photobacterium ganghwense]QSV17518.1 lytic transglycosylase domain-containing protein [Photobacterium ganghwense]